MSGLSDDCFQGAGTVMTAAEALDRIAAQVFPIVGVEPVALGDAANRILAEDAVAAIPSPPHDNAAVDGYGVHLSDLTNDGETRLPVGLRLPAGARPAEPKPGTATRIFTGAVAPAGVEAILMQEDVRLEEEDAIIPAGAKPGMNIRRAGEDVALGEAAIPAGRRLRAADIGLAAAIGLSTLNLRKRLRVGVFSTGDELTEPGAPLAPGGIYDANRLALKALCAAKGFEVVDLGCLRDDADGVRDALADAATRCDALITSGGMSEGEEDHVAAAIGAAGGSLAFWRLAVKPGRPAALGRIGDAPVIGLPGNPTAAIVMFLIFGAPLLNRLAGETPRPPLRFPIPAGFEAKKKKTGRREYLRVRIVDGPDGPVADRAGKEGSGILTTLTNADGLWEAEEDWGRIEPGQIGLFRPFPDLAL